MTIVPLISFIVPVYNTEKTLEKCLNSILNQTNEDYEIIIVNDGTKDDSQKLINEYSQKHPNKIKSFIKENGGLSDARNFGIKNSNGKLIAFVDSDDYIEKDYVNYVKDKFCQFDFDMLVIGYNRIYRKATTIFERKYSFTNWSAFDKIINLEHNPEMICHLEVASWLRIVKRSIIEDNSELLFTKGRVYEDLEASLKWYLHFDKVVVIEKKKYNYSITNNTLNFNINNVGNYFHIIRSVCDYYKQKNKFEKHYSELEYIFIKHILFSNLVRLLSGKMTNNYSQFIALRQELLTHFPNYHKNKYARNASVLIYSVVLLSYYFPQLFRLFLSGKGRKNPKVK